jgi:hypothetical protein
MNWKEQTTRKISWFVINLVGITSMLIGFSMMQHVFEYPTLFLAGAFVFASGFGLEYITYKLEEI